MASFSYTYARRTLLVSLVSVGMGFTVLFPVLAPLGREIGLTEIQITAIISASGLIVFLMSPIWGRLSDQWGRKRVMLIGLFGVSAGTALFSSVLAMGLSGILTGTTVFLALVGARMLHATVMAASMPAANAYMADITDAETRTKGMGAAGAANNLGSILGPAVSGLAVISLLAPLWVMAVVALLNGLFVWRYLREPPRHRSPVRPPRMKYTDPRILPFIIVGVLMFTGMGIVQQTMGFRFQDALGLEAGETAQKVGFAMMLSAAGSLLAQGVIVQRLTIAPFMLLRLAMPLLIVAFIMMALSCIATLAHHRHGYFRSRHGSRRARLHGRCIAGSVTRGAGLGSRGGRLLRPSGIHPWSAGRRRFVPACARAALRLRGGHVRCAVRSDVLAGEPGDRARPVRLIGARI